MTAALLLLALIRPAAAVELGGHEDPRLDSAAPASVDNRQAMLEEIWQRRLLPPDQTEWAPKDLDLLRKIRAVESDALAYLGHRPGGTRPWTSPRRGASPGERPRLTKEGYEHYLFLLTQDAIKYFEDKGADAKWAFKLRDWDDKPMFDGGGVITPEGIAVYRRARLNLEVFWKAPDDEVYGTRRPPKNP